MCRLAGIWICSIKCWAGKYKQNAGSIAPGVLPVKFFVYRAVANRREGIYAFCNSSIELWCASLPGAGLSCVRTRKYPKNATRVRRSAPCSRSRFALPVAVPGIFVGGGAPSSVADRCHSLSSLFPPPAAVASLSPRTPSHALSVVQLAFSPFNRCGDKGKVFMF